METHSKQQAHPLWASDRLSMATLLDDVKRNLVDCLETLRDRMENDQPGVAGELDTVARAMAKDGAEIDAVAGALHDAIAALRSVQGRSVNDATAHADRLQDAIGTPVVLTRAAIRYLQWKRVILESVNGASAIIRDQTGAWEAPVDRILVVPTGPPATPKHQPAAEEPPAQEPEHDSEMFLKLRHDELGTAVQFLALTARTGELEVCFPGTHPLGRVFFRKSRIVHITYKQALGIDALAAMFIEGDAHVRFYDGREAPVEDVLLSADQLLLEAAVLADEIEAGRNAVPVR